MGEIDTLSISTFMAPKWCEKKDFYIIQYLKLWSEQPPFKSKIWDNRLKNCEFLIPMDYIRCSYEGKMTFNALSQRKQD